MRLQRSRIAALLLAGGLLAAACGGTADEQVPTTDPGAPSTQPPAAGVCAPGEPDCEDTIVVGEDPDALPPSDEPSGSGDTGIGGAVVGGGLTVAEALATDATGILAVQGFVVDDGAGALFCEALAESYPPQCGGASVPLSGIEHLDPELLQSAQGVTWTDDSVVIFGELVDGTLVVDATVMG